MEYFKQETGRFEQISKDNIIASLKPIETRYNGYRFRSRTEARWAVFLDALEIKYEYEKEGFDLICGPYLPDFWLPYPDHLNFSGYPDAGQWLEIKGSEPTSEERTKLLHLTLETKHSGILVWGAPWNFVSFCTHRSGAVGFFIKTADDSVADMHILVRRFASVAYQTVSEAINKSKSARFEHGENG